MAIASFEDLCSGVCEIGGVPTPALARDDLGRSAMAMDIDGVEITLAHEPARSPQHAFLFAAFGPLPQGAELEACRELMNLNASLLRHGGACFSRHPTTGEVTLQSPYAFERATAIELYGRAHELASLVQRWRRRDFASSASTS